MKADFFVGTDNRIGLIISAENNAERVVLARFIKESRELRIDANPTGTCQRSLWDSISFSTTRMPPVARESESESKLDQSVSPSDIWRLAQHDAVLATVVQAWRFGAFTWEYAMQYAACCLARQNEQLREFHPAVSKAFDLARENEQLRQSKKENQ
jgi:hypothetical protein